MSDSSHYPSEAAGSGRAPWRLAAAWTLGIWVTAGLIFLIAHAARTGGLDTRIVLIVCSATSLGLLASTGLFALAWRVRHRRPAWRFGLVMGGSLAAGLAVSTGDALVGGTLIMPGAVEGSRQVLMWAIGNFSGFASLCALSGGVFTLLIQHQEILARDRDVAAARLAETEARAAAGAARLAALRYQLNPHFLFNTLNAISVNVIAGRNETAERMLEKLSDFLRATLASEDTGPSSLEAELEVLQAYLEIEGVRFGDRLQVEFDCPPSLMSAAMPSFLLQPLVENAIKYGVASTSRPVRVRVTAERAPGEGMVLTVSDDGDGSAAAAPSVGVGLANVRERLRAHYGDAAELTAGATAEGYRAVIRMPCVTL